MNDKDEYVESASHAQEIVRVKVPFDVAVNDIIRVKISWQSFLFIVSSIRYKERGGV